MADTPSELAFAEFRKRLEAEPEIAPSVREALLENLGADQPVDLKAFMVAVIQQARDENNTAAGAGS
jgi:hypothetical protein